MSQASRPRTPQHYMLPVDCDEYGTPPKSVGQTLTGEQKEQLERAIRLLKEKIVEDQWKAKKKKEEEAAAATWIDDMGVD